MSIPMSISKFLLMSSDHSHLRTYRKNRLVEVVPIFSDGLGKQLVG